MVIRLLLEVGVLETDLALARSEACCSTTSWWRFT
jgi:hypothetical protein